MASSDLSSTCSSSNSETFAGYFNINVDDDDDYPIDIVEVIEAPVPSLYHSVHTPAPPPPTPSTPTPRPLKTLTRPLNVKIPCYSSVPKEAQHVWDTIFQKGSGADVCVVTDENTYIMAHSGILSVASPVLASFIQQLKVVNGMSYIRIPGVPHGAVHAFIRFLYSSCYEEAAMKKFGLHMLVLSHAYSVPSLKRVCTYYLEYCWLTEKNVVDVLQLARKCDAPRLSLFCIRMVMKDFKTISLSEAWRVMRCSDPDLEQELLESIVEADSRKQERLKKIEERKVFLQLYEAMEALIHICRDGCGTIGPQDKMLKGSQVICGFPACKGLETLVRHFSTCKIRVPGGCVPCKRMWQLFELHSCMCGEPDNCRVPLCRHLKEKMQQRSKKDEARWKKLVSRVIAAKNTLGPFSA